MKEINFEIKIPKFLSSQNTIFFVKTIVSVLGLMLSIFLYNNGNFSLAGAAIFFYFILAVIWRVSERFSLAFAIIFLVSTVAAMILKNDEWSGNFSKYLYYLLVISTVQIISDGLFAKNGKKVANLAVDNLPGRSKRKIV